MVRTAVSTILFALAIGSQAAAQDTPDIDVHRISPIYVRADGTERRGQLLQLGPDSLTMLEQGTRHEIRLADITRIEARGDSVKNGAIIGAIVLGSWCALICPQGLDGYSNGQLPYILGVNIALGAAVGAGIDGMHVGRTTIYEAADGSAGRTGFRKLSWSMGFKF